MIRVEVGPQHGEAFEFTVPEFAIRDKSRQPLLDACRLVLARGADPARRIALYSPGSPVWRLRTTVGYGARMAASESKARFVPASTMDEVARERAREASAPRSLVR